MYFKKIIFLGVMAILMSACGENSEGTNDSENNDSTKTPQTFLSKGLVAHYKFDGNVQDSSGNGNHGIAYGGLTYTGGVINKAVGFDGVNDYIKIFQSNTLNNLKERATISFWTKYYKPTSGTNNVSVHITNGGDTSINHEYGYFNYSHSYGISFNVGYWNDNSRVIAPINATQKLNQQKFIFVSFVVTEEVLKVYKNGILIEEKERIYDEFSKASNDWFIGSQKGSKYFLNGIIDDLRIYNRNLSREEILKLYKMKNK